MSITDDKVRFPYNSHMILVLICPVFPCPTNLPLPKCQPSPHSPSRSSSPVSRFPRYLTHHAPSVRWAGYETTTTLPTYSRQLTGLSFQTYNSLSQNPCEVAAYLQSTCWQGSRCSPCVNQHDVLISCSVHCPSPPLGVRVCRPEW
jgi:hypothetical protein